MTASLSHRGDRKLSKTFRVTVLQNRENGNEALLVFLELSGISESFVSGVALLWCARFLVNPRVGVLEKIWKTFCLQEKIFVRVSYVFLQVSRFEKLCVTGVPQFFVRSESFCSTVPKKNCWESFCVSASFLPKRFIHRERVSRFSVKKRLSPSTESFCMDLLVFVSSRLCSANTALACSKTLCRGKQLEKKVKIRCNLEKTNNNRKKNKVPTKVRFLFHKAPIKNQRN